MRRVHWIRLAMQRRCVCDPFKIVPAVEIWNRCWLCWAPSELFLGSRARGRSVHRKEAADPTKMVCRLFPGFGDNRQIQGAPDYFRDVSCRHTFVGDSVIPGSSGAFFENQPVEPSSVELVYSGPAIESVTYVR